MTKMTKETKFLLFSRNDEIQEMYSETTLKHYTINEWLEIMKNSHPENSKPIFETIYEENGVMVMLKYNVTNGEKHKVPDIYVFTTVED